MSPTDLDPALRVRKAEAPPEPTAPIKILHLITGLDRGGAETALARLVRYTDPAQVNSIVVSLTDEGALGAELRRANVPVHALGLRRGLPTPGAFVRFLRLLRAERPHLVQSWLYHADLLALFARPWSSGTALLWNVRCSNLDLRQYSRAVVAIRRLLAWTSRNPTAIVVNSEAGRQYHVALGYHARRWEVVPNGFDTALFRPDAARRAAWRERLGAPEGRPLIGMVARVDPQKDHASFLAAAALVAAERADARFVLIGRETENLAIPTMLADRLETLGERGDVNEILPALDLAVLSSAWGEGFANVLGEAMACGVPCIATDVGDARLIIGETGMLVPPSQPAVLAAAILAWLARPAPERARAGALARQRVIAHYSIDAIVARYAEIYRSVIATKTV
jgi:glycosyltransferase involved in cell wall biosynthesis